MKRTATTPASNAPGTATTPASNAPGTATISYTSSASSSLSSSPSLSVYEAGASRFFSSSLLSYLLALVVFI
ncbi:hypothetical protein PMKS-004220 [Pichia membranifaciens]|uniref:Uncharacterized protein n=1 Tax=Pichia membranifaciens TaxID=4926 RepID=A0A1Q2YMJ5_9ASCO|nr:hypothetical protein PMKS-004220 [Pichia membranifaciens]